MPLDPSIILQGRAPQLDNPLDVQAKAQTLSNLGQQAKIQKHEIDVNQIKMAKQLAWSISDEPSYQAARQRGIELGLPNADKLPPNFDPAFVKSMQMNTLTAEEKFAREDRAVDLQYRDKQLENDKLNRQDAREERRYVHGIKSQEKAAERMEKKQTALAEVSDRKQNINDALDTVDKMIADKGTWEAFGSHNQDMERLIEQVATDMAKLQDPSSVARPSEVEAVKQNLIKSGFKNSNATARQIIANFRGEVDRRAENAYKVRGIQSPTGIGREADVEAYAKQHGIPYEQAANIKAQRTSNIGKK